MTDTTERAEALRLADAIENGWLENVDPEKADVDMIQAALRTQAERIASLEAERDKLRAEVERLRPNALRYEWLRSEHARVDPICHLSWKRNGDRSSSEWVNTSQLDKSIDLAIESAKEQQ